jgi:sarcosine oxidase subunit gamma
MGSVSVVETYIQPRSALTPFLTKGRYGSLDGKAGLSILEVKEFALASVTTFKNQKTGLKNAIKQYFEIDLPTRSKVATKDGISFVGIAPGQWLAFAETQYSHSFIGQLESCVGTLGAVVDQSDARAIVELSGPKVRSALSKGISIDLDERMFGKGDAATTMAAQLWITLWQTDETPVFRIAIFRAYGSSLVDWISTSAAEFGYEIIG